MLYLSTFITGLKQVVKEILARHGIRRVHLLLDGAVVYEHPRWLDIGCFHNTFEVIYHQKSGGRAGLDAFAAALPRQKGLPLHARRSTKNASFRIVTSSENKLVSIHPGHRAALERMIERKTGLTVNRAKADVEYWILQRSEGYVFFMQRMPGKRLGEKQLPKGALRPELAFMLNWLSRPQETDVFLDPFAGSGAIPFARGQMAGFEHMYVFDKSKDMTAALARQAGKAFGEKRKDVTVRQMDVADIPGHLPPQSVDKIVTDPPWGYYEQVDVAALYRTMFAVFAAIARPGALLVLLSAQKELVDAAVHAHSAAFVPERVYHILVSGKKASIYVLARR